MPRPNHSANDDDSYIRNGESMIITDGVHVVSTDSEDELHRFARKVGLKRQWYQNHPRHPHYDIISPRLLQRAYSLGAQKVDGGDILKRAWWAKKEQV